MFSSFGFKKISFKNLTKNSLVLYFSIFLLSLLISFIFNIIGYQDLGLVSSKILSIPILYIIYLFTIRIFVEEWFFRGFLVKRIGIFLSAFLFSLAHIGYASIVEIVGAFILGLLLGYYFKKTNNIYPNIIAHILYDVSVYVLLIC
jgi:membrane protease YdiL (CAAX protease family)